MGIYIEKLKLAVRKRFADAGIVDLNKAFQGYGDVPLDPSKLPFWMCEYIHGDIEDSVLTDLRNKPEIILFQYDLIIPPGQGTFPLSVKEDAIRKEFNTKTAKRFIAKDGAAGEIVRITSSDDITQRYVRRTLLFHVRCRPA